MTGNLNILEKRKEKKLWLKKGVLWNEKTLTIL